MQLRCTKGRNEHYGLRKGQSLEMAGRYGHGDACEGVGGEGKRGVKVSPRPVFQAAR